MLKEKSPGAHSEALMNNFLSDYTRSRASFDTTKEAARHHWRWLLPALGIADSYLDRHHGPCPACGGSDRFRFDDKDGRGTYFCNQCGAGDGFRLLELANSWTAKQTLHAVAEALKIAPKVVAATGQAGQGKQPGNPSANREKQRAKLNRIWRESAPVTEGTPAWTYLTQTRGIPLASIPHAIRQHPALTYWEPGADGKPRNRGQHPVLVIQVAGADGKPVGLRLIYLTADGQKLPVSEPKKLQVIEPGATTGGATRLAEPGQILAVTEGIETGLAVLCATGLPVWAAGSAVLLEKMLIPVTVREVLIFTDNDLNKCGQHAGEALAGRLRNEHKAVELYTPPEAGLDWLDVFYGDQANA